MTNLPGGIAFNNLPDKPENTNPWRLRLQRWMAQLDEQMGPPDDIMLLPAEDNLPDVVVAVYHNHLITGRTLALTFGGVECKMQVQGQYLPELALWVDSNNANWPAYLGNLVAWCRGVDQFEVGAMFDMSAPFAFPSLLDGFVLDELDKGLKPSFPKFKMLTFKIKYYQALPIYRGEQALLLKAGLTKFKGLPSFDAYNPARPNLSDSFGQN